MLLSLLNGYALFAQQTPTISPAFFHHNDLITVTYDVSGTSLVGLTKAYIWVWIPGPNLNSKFNINPASANPGLTDVDGPAGPRFTKIIDGPKTLFRITFRPSDFFTQPISSYSQIGMLLKGNDWSNGQTADHVATFWNGEYTLQLTTPATQPLFVSNGQTIPIRAVASENSDFTLLKDNLPVTVQNNATEFHFDLLVTETSGGAELKIMATNGTVTEEVEFQYLISGSSPTQPRPSGIIPGINYNTDPSRVTLCLWAPGKSSVFAFGDFSDWKVKAEYLMWRDGEFFWIELTDLVPGEEYAFQYLVNQTLKVADPYADKILDPDDEFIPENTYPGIMPFPTKAKNSQWYYNRLSVFQTNQVPYPWQTVSYQRPPKESLVIYEALIRDLFEEPNRNYQSLIDTLGYFKRLGINAIELMPIMEFNGNKSWGYNPTFMFAPDKYYGTKNKLKEFIDKAHEMDIAVILDIALNHQDIPNTYAMLDFNFSAFKPNPTNLWFNETAKHPFNVFFDMNHESPYTQAFVDTVCHYWLNEYKVDGFRFDLSKGFTQKNTGSDVGAWSAYDATRVALIKRMADKIWTHSPDAFIILEHFGENSEERELAQYRMGEDKGMLFWGNMNYSYNQTTMGYADGSDFSGVYHGSRGWGVPHLIGYMESHDEERNMFRNLSYGNSTASYSVKNLPTALYRMRGAATVFYTIPGPKMIWQFGELGFEFSINHCANGTISEDCRLAEKPVVWHYQADFNRQQLFNHIRDLLRLRSLYDVFTEGDASLQVSNSSLVKQITLRNKPYTSTPVNTDDMNAQIVVNFDVVPREVTIEFPHQGTWFDYYRHGLEVNVTGPFQVTLYPGEYKLFTDVQISNTLITGIEPELFTGKPIIYPNPAGEVFSIESAEPINKVQLFSIHGQLVKPERLDELNWSTTGLTPGIYLAVIETSRGIYHQRVIKR